MLCGIRDIALVTNPEDVSVFKRLLGDGSQIGISLTYFVQEKPNGLPEALTITKEYIRDYKTVLILGDNLLIGLGLGTTLESHLNREGASILAFPVSNPSEYGVVELDERGKVISIEEKPINPKSHFAVPGIYFLDENASKIASELSPSNRGELEITDLLKEYLKAGKLQVTTVRRGTGWMDAGTTESLYAASELVRVLQNRQGYRFNVPEEIAFNKGWISKQELTEIAIKYKGTAYGQYISEISE